VFLYVDCRSCFLGVRYSCVKFTFLLVKVSGLLLTLYITEDFNLHKERCGNLRSRGACCFYCMRLRVFRGKSVIDFQESEGQQFGSCVRFLRIRITYCCQYYRYCAIVCTETRMNSILLEFTPTWYFIKLSDLDRYVSIANLWNVKMPYFVVVAVTWEICNFYEANILGKYAISAWWQWYIFWLQR
jgi:hypothetical protein